MSDTWYRIPLDLPPYEASPGQWWTLDGVCVNPQADSSGPSWLDGWLVDLQWVASQAAVNMELLDEYWRIVDGGSGA